MSFSKILSNFLDLAFKKLLMKNYFLFLFILAVVSCQTSNSPDQSEAQKDSIEVKTEKNSRTTYTEFTLTTDLTKLSEKEKQMIPLLINAAQEMDHIFWMESSGKKDDILGLAANEEDRSFIIANYGPWDRLDGNKPFIDGINDKPLGAQFYPEDMTKEEFNSFDDKSKSSLYTLIRRDETGALVSVPYRTAFAEHVSRASEYLAQAAKLAENEALKNYLELRSQALLTDEYDESDRAWLDMKDNTVDCIIGPIENYEDQLFGYKAAHEAYVLVKDKEWSKRLEKYVAMLPALQEGLPCDDKFKQEKPGTSSQLNAYDVIYYAGDCNSGGKTIAVNLPNDENIQLEKGTRRSQLKNAMRAKFDKILVPISKVLIVKEQRKHVTFPAFFGNTMFHEVAHGLGIKNTVNGKGKVKDALKETHSALEEGKADILGLYMVTQLFEKGEIDEGVILDNYVTFMASIFRSVRFGASSAHGKANMIRFNYFQEQGAFTRDENGYYSINFDQMQQAMNSLCAEILRLQGEGDYEGVKSLIVEKGLIGEQLSNDLDRVNEAGIPVDIIFNQGIEVLGLGS